jgi:hypothetical protein
MIFAVWRSTLYVVDFVGMALSTERAGNPYKDVATYPIYPQHPYVDGWMHWDSGWYKRITERGYYIEGRQSNVAFFPLFPYSARFLGHVIGNPYVAGLILSNLATLFALFFLYLLACELMDDQRARTALVLLLCFPGSFFLSAYYAEGMFLCAASASALGYHRRNWLLAGIAGFFATLARPTGVALFAAFAADYGLRVWRKDVRFTPRALLLLLIPAGLGVFMLMLAQQVGDPWAWVKFQAGWGRKTVFPLATIWNELARFDWSFPRGSEKNMDLVETGFSIIGLAVPVTMAVWRRHRTAPWMWLFVLLSILMTLTSGKSQSMVRHTAVCFPAFLWLADVTAERPLLHRWLIYVFSTLLVLFNLRYLNWYWSG